MPGAVRAERRDLHHDLLRVTEHDIRQADINQRRAALLASFHSRASITAEAELSTNSASTICA
ncbi:hypothetical protein HC928_13185, partial [bacterium]|nr:hypothetical protein [bacterium]